MKAIFLTKAGGIENLVEKEIGKPALKANEVLIQVKSIGINPVEAFVRENQQYLEYFLQLEKGAGNVILGWDVSGLVVETGKEVGDFQTGDKVFGMINFPGAGKAYAEYVAAPADQIALKPENVSFEAAAAATLAALTAWQAFSTSAKIKKGEKVLIHAAAGGVGHYAIQIAKWLGAYVIASASAESRQLVLDLGADEFIDYKAQKFEEVVTDADVVLDSLYDDHISRSLKSLKRGGRLVSLVDYGTDDFKANARAKDVQFLRITVSSNGEDMKQIAELLGNGKLKSVIAKAYPFDKIAESHLQVEKGKTHGKIVVNV